MSQSEGWAAAWASLKASIAANNRRSAEIVERYKAIPGGERRSRALVIYRCKARECTCLYLWRSDDRHLIYLRNYKLRPDRNEATSTAAGRERNSDGRGGWPSRGQVLDDLRSHRELALPVKCAHVDSRVSVGDVLADLARAQPGRPTERWF